MKIHSVVSVFILFSGIAHAGTPIKGSYLPESEIPSSVCKIQVGSIVQTYTPTYQNGISNGKPSFTRVEKDIPMCSATLIAPNTILTAAHCFVGNNQQDMPKGTFAYPKMINGVIIPQCQKPKWEEDPNCVASKEYGVVTTKWNDVEAICPTVGKDGSRDGKHEARPLVEETGYPNPLFKTDAAPDSVSNSNFDVTVWRFEQPMVHVPVAAVEFDDQRLMQAIDKDYTSCQSFGYGLDNDDKAGVLRGANTPITKADEAFLLSDTGMLQDNPFLQTGRTDHGDSGGALMCTAVDGKKKLFGVVSRGGEEDDQATGFPVDVSIYAKVSYNASWIQKILKDAPLKRDLNSKWWHSFVLPYEQEQMNKALDTLANFLKKNRNNMERDIYISLEGDLSKLHLELKNAIAEYHRYGDDAGLLRTRVRVIFSETQQVYFEARKSINN